MYVDDPRLTANARSIDFNRSMAQKNTDVERDAAPVGIFAAWQHEARGRLAAATGDWRRALDEFPACGERT